MCFGGGDSNKGVVNKPGYTPDQMDKQFTVTETREDGTKRVLQKPDGNTTDGTEEGPKVQKGVSNNGHRLHVDHDSIRM